MQKPLLKPGDQRLGNAAPLFNPYLERSDLEVRVVADRSTKTGDFRYREKGRSIITINRGLGTEAFLIILAHEIAHFEVRMTHGRRAKPHGPEWKVVFGGWLMSLVEHDAFNVQHIEMIRRHAIRPKASLAADKELWKAVIGPESLPEHVSLESLPTGAVFMLNGRRTFRKMEKRRTRYTCMELPSRRIYLVSGHALVKVLET